VTDPNEVAIYLNYGDSHTTAYLDPVAATILGQQLIAAARAAFLKRAPK
jgi:hypothetical protein